MDLFGTHKISYESIRRLAIECHALDVAAVDLLVDTTLNKAEATRASYEGLFSEKLLALAIGVRTKFYQGVSSQNTSRFISHSAFLFNGEDSRKIFQSFTIKDVCDKIVHAQSINRSLSDGTRQPITLVRGKHKEMPWELQISTSLFCEGIINWIDSLEAPST